MECADSSGDYFPERFQVSREAFVKECARSPIPQPLDDIRPGHSELIQDNSGDERGTVEAHTAVRQNSVAGTYEVCTQITEGVKLFEVGQLLIENRKIDIEALIRNGRNTLIEAPIQVNDRVDVVPCQNFPVADCGRNIEVPFVVDLNELHRESVA